MRISFAFDACRLDDRPPLFDLGPVNGFQRLGRLLRARRNRRAQVLDF
jgi:hypothetical protein